MKMPKGDLNPPLKLTLSGSDPVDVTGRPVRIIGRQNGELLFDRAPDLVEIVGNVSIVTMNWQTGDTDTLGRIRLEVEVNWYPDNPQTFPVEKYKDVLVVGSVEGGDLCS